MTPGHVRPDPGVVAGPIDAIRTAARAMSRIGRRQNETAQNVGRAFVQAADMSEAALDITG